MTERQQAFVTLLNQAHTKSKRSCVVVAGLSGVALSYFTELLAGQKRLVSFHILRHLCEEGWQLPHSKCLPIFAARLAIDPFVKAPLPTEFFWRLAKYSSLSQFAHDTGIERSYFTKIMQARRIPSYPMMLQICRALAYDEPQATKFHSAYWQRARVERK